MAKQCLLLVISLTFFIASTNLSAQPEEPQGNSRFVLTLNDNLIASLKSLGTLQSSLQEDAHGKIAAVQLQFSGSATEAAVTTEAHVAIAGNACQIKLDDSLIEMARTQPIRIDIPENSSFSRVFLNYDTLNSEAPASSDSTSSSPEPMLTDSRSNYSQHFVQLSDTEKLAGQLDLSESLKFNTKFGEVEITLGQIAGIRFHIDGDDAAIVVLKNGDNITGVPMIKSFNLNTDWGRAEFDPVYVEAITTSANGQFHQSSDPDFGARWQLIGR